MKPYHRQQPQTTLAANHPERQGNPLMKVQLKAGAEIDVLSADEYREQQTELRRLIAKANSRQVMNKTISVTANPSGLLAATAIFTVPLGYVAEMNRTTTNAEGHTPLSPLTSGYLEWYRNNATPANLVMFLPVQNSIAVAPTLTVEGTGAIVLNEGETIVVAGNSLPANQQIAFGFQFRLWENVTA